MRRSIPPAQLCALQQKPESVRNICILAHVDHGKTTLADSLVASNGVISARLAGKLRYMDSREDEQLRGITMKSSAIALLFEKASREYLVNLVDSPGHVDFSSEVSTAVRACDGAIVLVDSVEGVCPQTHVVLRQAWREGVKPVLVINKIDRLITELQMSPTEAHLHLLQVLEQVNAVTGSLFATEVMETAEREAEEADGNASAQLDARNQFEDWDLGFDKKDEDSLYFSPDKGNVVFASAVDGWGFRLSDFASLYSAKLGIKASILLKTLWGDYYVNMKAKKIMKGAQAKGKKPLFVQFVLDNMWAVYEAVNNREKEKVARIAKSMGITVAARDLRSTDPRVHLQAVCGQWLPLAQAVLGMVVEHLPCPLDMSEQRAEQLLCGGQRALSSYPERTQALKADLLASSSADGTPLVAFVSKMFSVRKSELAQSKTSSVSSQPMHASAVTAEEIAARRQQAKIMSQQRAVTGGDVATVAEPSPVTSTELPCRATDGARGDGEDDTNALLAFMRVFSGTLTTKQPLLVLRGRHDPSCHSNDGGSGGDGDDDPAKYPRLDDDAPIVSCQPTQIYLLMGRELIAIDSAPAGSVVGVAGLDEQILRHGTVSSTTALPPLAAMEFPTSAVVRVALEPGSAAHMGLLLRGLRRLRAADPAVEYGTESSGEVVLSTAGEVHLERCLDDLRQVYAPGLEVAASDPIVPFRETVVPPPDLDMVNEAIVVSDRHRGDVADDGDDSADEAAAAADENGTVTQHTADHSVVLRVRAVPLPTPVAALLERNAELLRALALLNASKESSSASSATASSASQLKATTMTELAELRAQLGALLSSHDVLGDALDSIIAFGPRQVGPNVLVNRVAEYRRASVWRNLDGASDVGGGGGTELRPLDHSILHGFQLTSFAGPLCQEPVHGVCFLLETWSSASDDNDGTAAVAAGTEPCVNGLDIPCSTAQAAASPPAVGSLALSPRDRLLSESELSVGSPATSGSEVVGGGGSVSSYGPLSGQLMSAMKEACRRAMLVQPVRIMTAMYSCEIHATSEVLGRVYAVLGRRGGRVLHEDLRPGSTNVFSVRAVIPVAESFGFAPEIRKKTSGSAMPQLFFSHWEVVPSDPFWVPTTDEELLHFGEKADSENSALVYMNSVRRRKGLTVYEKIVEHAEKQRTMMRT